MSTISRRDFLTASTATVGSLVANGLFAKPAFAQDVDTENSIHTAVSLDPHAVELYDCTGMNEAQVDMMIMGVAEQSTGLLMEDIAYSGKVERVGGRPSYWNRYGKPLIVRSGYRDIFGQPSRGFKFAKPGGSVGVAFVNRGTINLSFGFPLPWGSISLGCTFGGMVPSSVSVVSQFVPGDGRSYKITLNNTYKSIPYTTMYRNSSGVVKVFGRFVTPPVVINYDFGLRRV